MVNWFLTSEKDTLTTICIYIVERKVRVEACFYYSLSKQYKVLS